MGLFDIFSGKYKPESFIDKTPEQIFNEIKLDKLTPEFKTLEGYDKLSPDVQAAFDLLYDFKEKDAKNRFYRKCYKPRESAHASFKAPMPRAPGSPRPVVHPHASMKAPAAAAAVAVAAAGPVKEADERQSGGGKRGKKSRKGKKSRRQHKKKRKTSRR